MYNPPSNAEHRPEAMHAFMDAHPLAALVTATADGLLASHLPLLLDRAEGPLGTLRGHIARANPHHRQTFTAAEALVIFSGLDAYISPSWYPGKREHGEEVPTWNYVAVHAYGAVRFHDDAPTLRRHLEALTDRHEGGREAPWSVDDAPADYIARQLKAIVGVEISIARLEGRWKMSQNRSSSDIDGVVNALGRSPADSDRAVAALVQQVRPR